MCVECAKKVTNILDQMEKGGEWKGLSEDEKEVERQTMGLRIRAGIDCSPDWANREAGRMSLKLAKAVENLKPKGAALRLADCHGQDPADGCADGACEHHELCEAL
ncbi:unnamed protein product, partial [marine sediment metagenome]